MRKLIDFAFQGLLVTFLLLHLAVRGAAVESPVLTAQDVARLQQVSSAAISPDGRHVAYTLSVPREPGVDEDGNAWNELWVADWAGQQRRPFVTGKVEVGAVQWTPDGRQIGFLAKRGEDEFKALYLIPVDGGEARRAAGLEADLAAYSFAPDGLRAAVLATEPEPPSAKKLRDKGFKQQVYEEDWRLQKVWVLELFGANTNAQPLAVRGHVHQVRWGPQGSRLALTVTPTPAVDDSYVRQRARVVDADNGQEIGRIENPGKLGRVALSPDAQWLAMIAGEDIHDPSEGRLLVAPAQGGEWRDWLPGFEGQVEDFLWTDSQTLLYLASKGVQTLIGRVRVANGTVTNHTLYGPGGPALVSLCGSVDGQRLAMVGSTPQHPFELLTLDPAEGFVRRRTESNPWLAFKRLAVQEVVRHKARDGVELEGILIRPLDEQPGRKYPLVLSVHGGPEAHVQHGWQSTYNRPGQVAAARGLAVFAPNYRGSTGRGVAFSKLGQGDPAGREFDDLVDAVDHFIQTGLADAKRIGVTGGSYGGYATAWCCTRYSDRFAAGVMFVGISDKVSKVGTTDIPDEEFYVHALMRPWDKWEFLLERSPIYHAGQTKTPLLILHGKDDPRVNPGQSLEMYRHLKLRSQAPVRLVLYPGEQHGNRKAAARLDYNLRMLRWLEHYLKGPGGERPPYELDYGLPPDKSQDKP